MAKFQVGHPGYRKPGTKNKLPRDLKNKMLAISEKLDEKNKGLADEAEKDPRWFLEHFLKPMLPKNIDISAEVWTREMTDDQVRAEIKRMMVDLGYVLPATEDEPQSPDDA